MSSYDVLVSNILSLREQISGLTKQIDGLQKSKAAYEGELMEVMGQQGVTQLGTTAGTATMKASTKFVITDWPNLLEYIKENDAFDILQKRITVSAIADRMTAEEQVPGVAGIPVFSVSIRKK